jgi:alkanesulfonate monooxygenase SsuD/methylene tetrahydromethanopterin reductase-like flavin-dependent oxidoreductase (luciferase family)
MRIGLYVHAQHPASSDSATALNEHLEQTRAAREGGFASLFAGQHFLPDPFWMFQPIPLLARLAAEAEDMELGTGVLLLPLLNPVDVAEQAASLDVIAGGRSVVGIGYGYRKVEDDALNVPTKRATAYAQKAHVLSRLLAGETVTASGPGYELDSAALTLQPLQKPRPPIWAAAVTDAGIARQAPLADAWFMPPMSTVSELEHGLAIDTDKRGGTPSSRIPVMREACIAKTDEAAIAAARPFLEEKYRVYAGWGQSETLGDGWDALAADRFLVGSPETVTQELSQLSERLGATDVSLRLAWPGFPHAATMRSIELLASEVIPRLRAG